MENTCRLCLNVSPEIVEELLEGCDVLHKLSKCFSYYVRTYFKNSLTFIKQENELSVNKSSISGEELENLETVVKSELTEASKYSTYYEDDNLYLNDLNNENSLNNIDSEEKRTSHKNLSNINTDDIPTNILTENKNLIIDTSAKIDELKRHMCLTCFEIFPNPRELLNHYRTIELERYNTNNIGNNDKTEPVQYKLYESEDGTLVYKCEKCDRKYVHKALIERHIKSHIEKRPFLCKLCGKTYQTASIIVSHGKMHTGEVYTCLYNCGYQSVHKHVIKDHEKRHRKEFKYKCETCGKGFQVRTSYEQHQNIHNGIKPFSCEICGMKFHLHKYLTTHRSNVHPQTSVRKPWVCKHCLLPCDSKNSLNIHLKDKHDIIVKISILCDICGKVFRDTQQLKSHQRSVHLNIKPYTCSVCNKSFPKKFTLKVHEQTHTGKMYVCSVCDKKFLRQSSLQRHLQRFHAESQGSDQKCNKMLLSNLKTQRHVKNSSKTVNITPTA
ncbi:gastrula zinc finger protein XlCGF26.1-like [Melitaea cinxia]|uniref:gastrula zinc finger protein XlCGF26.1-like n=1 Tax=Melitaea cinxia TaxID=113334 RepID=UPI001E270D83|nr:gastrula zinc finger protein XlCGF26.1-like [Melitaea cinxia]